MTRLWVPIVGIAAAAIVVPNLFLHERVRYEASSVGSLRTISTRLRSNTLELTRTRDSPLRLPNWALIPPHNSHNSPDLADSHAHAIIVASRPSDTAVVAANRSMRRRPAATRMEIHETRYSP